VVAAAAIGLAACGGSGSSGSGAASSSTGGGNGSGGNGSGGGLQQVTLVNPAPEGLGFIGLIMAEDRFFKQEGLQVKAVPTDGSSFVTQQLIAGHEKYGVASLPATYIAAAKGADLHGIASLTHDDAAQLSVPTDSPIHSVADLRGKAVGITSPGDGAVPVVEAVLRSAGLTPNKDVRLVVVGAGGPAVAVALKSGKIAAYAAGLSDRPGVEVNGGVALRSILPPQYTGLPANQLVVGKGVLDDQAERDVAIQLARGWIKGAQFADEHPDEALQIGCKRVPEQCKNKKVAELLVKLSASEETPLDPSRPGYFDMTKGQAVADTLKDQVSSPVDLSKVFLNDYVSSYK
jgi:NitT/TauT family transport system substrate-binding protein